MMRIWPFLRTKALKKIANIKKENCYFFPYFFHLQVNIQYYVLSLWISVLYLNYSVHSERKQVTIHIRQ